MNSADLAQRFNELGVLCRSEVSGVQYQFKLKLSELDPKSAVFNPNRNHLKDTVYTLIPESEAAQILKVGRSLFTRLLEHLPGRVGDCDYTTTFLGRYVSHQSVGKLEDVAQSIEREMRSLARTFVHGKFKDYYAQAFRFAYSFFHNKNNDFRGAIRMFNSHGDLVWAEVNRIYRELAEWENEIRRINKRRRLVIRDINSLEEKLAFKLSRLPRTEEEYLASIKLYLDYYAFHPYSIPKGVLRISANPQTFAAACSHLNKLSRKR